MQQTVSSKPMNTAQNNRWMVASLVVLLLTLVSTTWTKAANANPPGKMTFQGFLTDASTPPVPLGNTAPVNKTITFTIYDNGTGGNVKWAESQVVTIDKGHFSVLLGEGSSVTGQPHATDLSNVFIGADASDRWIGIQVEGESEITPRIQFFAAPYAQLAKAATSLTNGGTNNPITVGGNLTVTGRTDVTGDVGVQGYLGVSGNAGMTGALSVGSLTATGTVTGGSLTTTGAVTGNSLNVTGDAVFQRANGTRLDIQTPASDARIVAGAPSNTLLLNPSGGKVGIGTAAPESALDVGGVVTADSVTVDSLNVNTLASVKSMNIDGDFHFQKTTTDARIFSSLPIALHPHGGRVGIGTASPQAPLDVSGSTTHTFTHRYLNFHEEGGPISNTPLQYSIIADQRIVAPEFNATSDRRSKKAFSIGDASKDLETIRKLRVTDYQMIDQIANGAEVRKGFIAQEVEQIIPEAITKGSQIIPNIYSLASSFEYDAEENTLVVVLSEPHGIVKGDHIRIICEEWHEELEVTRVPSPTQLIVGDVKEAPSNVFVYGKRVEDFRTLNYDRIFTTGISAIQELARRNDALQKKVTALESRDQHLAALEKRVTELEKIEQEFVQLKKLVSSLVKDSDRSDQLAAVTSEGSLIE